MSGRVLTTIEVAVQAFVASYVSSLAPLGTLKMGGWCKTAGTGQVCLTVDESKSLPLTMLKCCEPLRVACREILWRDWVRALLNNQGRGDGTGLWPTPANRPTYGRKNLLGRKLQFTKGPRKVRLTLRPPRPPTPHPQ